MRVFVTGGTGFIGAALVERLLARGDRVTILSRSRPCEPSRPGLAFVQGDPAEEGAWQDEVGGHDAVVNLAGASIFRRWTGAGRKLIHGSRVRATRNLITALAGTRGRPVVLVNGSAIGYYGSGEDEEFTEAAGVGTGFLARLVRDWEAAALAAEEYGVRVVLARFGVVLGPGGGALARMAPPFRLGLGAVFGSGRQWFSWIGLDDLISALVFLLEEPGVAGPVNCTAPFPVTNRELSQTLARVLHRPLFLPPVPAWLLQVFLGEAASLFLDGQRVVPERLIGHGFCFRSPRLDETLADLI
ncbi:MAG: TIGR01777 family oxidoreductase [Desulfobacterales bacterium]|nr:TIGR01777 family oxidoreductase [Desulfobacterales bacterium]